MLQEGKAGGGGAGGNTATATTNPWQCVDCDGAVAAEFTECDLCGAPQLLPAAEISNVTALPDAMIGEILERTHSDDLLAAILTCKIFRRVQRQDTSRDVRPPPGTHVVTSEALVTWARDGGWAWPTKDKHCDKDDPFAACRLAAGGGCIAAVQRARDDGHPWDSSTCSAARRAATLRR